MDLETLIISLGALSQIFLIFVMLYAYQFAEDKSTWIFLTIGFSTKFLGLIVGLISEAYPKDIFKIISLPFLDGISSIYICIGMCIYFINKKKIEIC